MMLSVFVKFTNAPGSPFKVTGDGHSFVAGDVNRGETPDLL
jgi:hypothetical protein